MKLENRFKGIKIAKRTNKLENSELVNNHSLIIFRNEITVTEITIEKIKFLLMKYLII